MKEKKLTPIRAIRLYCVGECCAGSTRDARLCNADSCPLHKFRMGHNPDRKGIGPKNNTWLNKDKGQ